MKEKGFAGVLITDAGGANQDGNRQVPAGPLFGSEPWRELYRHALREGKRLGFEMALMIQSGWNLGGPNVPAEDAAKIFCTAETALTGPGEVSVELSAPKARAGVLGEVAVVAYREDAANAADVVLSASSSHAGYPPSLAADGGMDTFWVSDGVGAPDGSLVWFRATLDEARAVEELVVRGRPKYGPKSFEVFAIDADGEREKIADGSAGEDGVGVVTLDKPRQCKAIEIRVLAGYDPTPVGGLPRNVQIAELQLSGSGWSWPMLQASGSIQHWDRKVLVRPVGGANFDTTFLVPAAAQPGEGAGIALDSVLDISEFVEDGTLQWNVPEGRWRVIRLCYTVSPRAHVSTCTEGWEGFALDPMDSDAFQRYWDSAVEPLMEDMHALEGNTLRYLHTDSWEIEPYNWTPKLPQEFRQRRGYTMTPWMPVLAKRTVVSREASERFLHDFRKTVAELTAEKYYGTFAANATRHGLQLRTEAGGPHGVPIDAQHCLGLMDTPMSEFWATSWRHRVPRQKRFFIKQPASAAHTYGKRIVSAEGFTTIGPHWQERVWNNLRPNFDHALCEGLNQLVWTLLACSPKEMGLPGQDMFAGTHFNPNSTWWRQSEAFLAYINRCQWMLRQGHFVADVLHYYGDHSPNFAGSRVSNPAGLPDGYDYDVASEHVMLNRLAVDGGRIVLPDGMSYAAISLPNHRSISLAVLRRLDELADAGATLIGPRPDSSPGLSQWLDGDAEAHALIDRLWGVNGAAGKVRFTDSPAWLASCGLPPDFICKGDNPTILDFTHRRDGNTDIYFVDNTVATPFTVTASFRVGDNKVPEFWNPEDGTVRRLPVWSRTDDGRVEVPLEFDACGSGFVVFRDGASTPDAGKGAARNFAEVKTLQGLTGPWQVSFDPDWFYPDNGSGGNLAFNELTDWTAHTVDGVKYFSGEAVYRKTFDLSDAAMGLRGDLALSLGDVREMARVRINGKNLGVAWCPPWRVRIPPRVLKTRANVLEVEVVNFWPNRLIGDTKLPEEQRRTSTNITKFENPRGDKHYSTLMPSGLLGPVKILTGDE